MPFLTFSNADFLFGTEKFTWRSYTIAEALPITSRVELIDKRKFAKVAMDENSETFVIDMSALDVAESSIHHFQAAQIAALQWDKALTKIPAKYSDYADIFSSDLAIKPPKNTGMNEHAIELIKEKQSPYGPIYALNPVELVTLKTYIETYLKTGFIPPFKSPAVASILFDKKLDGGLCLCIDYQSLNNLTIKNQYPLPLIEEALDRLGQAKQFTQLDLTSAYYQMRIREGDKWKTTFRI